MEVTPMKIRVEDHSRRDPLLGLAVIEDDAEPDPAVKDLSHPLS
jgi:hypothetical protein